MDTTEAKQQGIESLKAKAEFRMFVPPIHPDQQRVRQHCKLRKEEIKGIVRDDEVFWQNLLEQGCDERDYQLGDGFSVRATCRVEAGGESVVGLTLYDTTWGEERILLRDRYFFNEGEFFGDLPVELVAQRLNIAVPLRDFRQKKSTRGIEQTTDAHGLGIDDNILELVRYINALGFSTTASCGGHNEGNQLPYLHFLAENLEEIVKLALLIKSITGHEWFLNSDHFLTDISLSPNKGTTLAECQRGLDKVTDYLAQRMKIDDRLTPREWVEKLRRKFGCLFRMVNG